MADGQNEARHDFRILHGAYTIRNQKSCSLRTPAPRVSGRRAGCRSRGRRPAATSAGRPEDSVMGGREAVERAGRLGLRS